MQYMRVVRIAALCPGDRQPGACVGADRPGSKGGARDRREQRARPQDHWNAWQPKAPFVYAGARSQKQAGRAPNTIKHPRQFGSDVTRCRRHCGCGPKRSRAPGEDCNGVVNNAGIVVVAPLIEDNGSGPRVHLQCEHAGPRAYNPSLRAPAAGIEGARGQHQAH